MKIVVVDIETDGLDASTIWVIVTRDVDESKPKVWTGDYEDFAKYAKTVDMWVAHNGLTFDIPVINRLTPATIDPKTCVDTFVVSRLVNYTSFSTHSLDEIGASLNIRKKQFNDWSQLTQTMIDYCIQDVEVTLKVFNRYRKYIFDPEWSKSMRLEHDIVLICEDMKLNGFSFDTKKAESLLSSVKDRMSVLEEEFQRVWPPELVEVNRLKYRIKADGSLFKSVSDAIGNYPKTERIGDELVCYDYKEFNPGSTKDRVEKLWQAGWSPTEKSKTHYKFLSQAKVGSRWGKTILTEQAYEEKKKYFEFYGWTVSEENLLTLPESAPEGARALAEWLTLEGRRSSLVEWLGCVSDDGRIHGKFWHIGAWTHRMSHSSPNSANISAPFHGEPKNKVEEVKLQYDGEMRSCWKADDNAYLVGTDAEGIQLRVLAHYLKNDDYVEAIVNGKKEDETDIHSVNRRALGLNHLTRDDAKTFIYAHILGAGLAKTARILRASQSTTRQAVSDFQSRLGLDVLRRGIIQRDARRGYFDGLDGRKVLCSSDHLMLAGYLQNGESVVMKWANRLWRQWADDERINYKQVNYVHDEWQTECYGSLDMAERLGELQRNSIVQAGKDLGVYCPLAGSTDIGRNWCETH